MRSEDDIFKIISDFMKGKLGPPDMEMAMLSFEGDVPPEELHPPKLSTSYDEFIKEYPVVISGLSRCSLEHCLAIFGSMLTLPEFQSNTYRLELLIHLAFICAKGKQRPTPAQIVAWFNQLDNGTCARQEDPAEDVFLSVVAINSSSYRLFEGTAEGNTFHTQLFLNILAEMPEKGIYSFMKAAVESLLRLSDAIAGRIGFPVYGVGNTTPVSRIQKPSSQAWSTLRARVGFSFEELEQLGIDPRSLRPFLADASILENLLGFSPGYNPIDFKPIYPTQDGLIVFLPSLLGTAIRYFVIQNCLNAGMADALHQALANAYAAHFSSESFLGSTAPPFDLIGYDGFYASQVVIEMDKGRYLHLLFFVDGFENFEQGWFIGINPIEKISDFARESISHAHETCSGKDGFREGLSLVIGCGWGRALGLGLAEAPVRWRTEMIPAHDATTLGRTPSFETLDLLRVLDACDALNQMNIGLSNANGFLNLFGWIKGNNGHIFPHEKFGDNFGDEAGRGFFSIPINCNLRLRHTAYLAADVRTIRRPDGSTAKLRRVHGTPRYGTEELSPFYADIAALDERIYRSVYIGERGIYWGEAKTSAELDIDTRYHLSNMTMHWCEVVFQHFDEDESTHNDIRVSCCFNFLETRIPDGSDPIPNEDEIRTLVERRDHNNTETPTVVFDVKAGFMSAARRSDNLGERAIVRAIIEACFETFSRVPETSEIEEVLNAIVKTDNARHFHAFTVPKLHDYVREDLPREAQIIEKMDDANSRLGLGWLCRDPAEPRDINGLEQCKEYLRKLVGALIQKFKANVAQFDKQELVVRLLRNHEKLFAEMDTWKRTFGAVEALSRDGTLAADAAIEQLGRFNAASMSCRISMEAAICECPNTGGLTPGEYDIAQLLTYGSLIHHMGGYSEAMIAGMMPPEIRISPAGEVMMNHEFSEAVIQPFGQFFQTNALKSAARRYVENYTVEMDEVTEATQEKIASDHDKQFEAAWQEEFGFPLESLGTFVGGIDSLLTTDRKAVLRIKLSGLTERLCVESKLSREVVAACITAFSFVPREVWDAAPAGYLKSAWFPWQFRRQLSLVSKPIIHLSNEADPECLIAPAMTIMNITKFVSDARMGAFDQRMFRQDGLMFKWIGLINGDLGEAFNDKVATEFRKAGWDAQSNLSDGKILNRKKNPAFGDVDVLAWNEPQKRVLVVECKDLSFDKTIGEIARRLANYQGATKANGKRDDLRKHLDRCLDVEANILQLSQFVGFNVERIERVLLFSQSTPLQFAEITEQHSVIVCTFDDIRGQFTLDD